MGGACGSVHPVTAATSDLRTPPRVVLPLLKIGVLYKLLSQKQQASDNLDKYLHWMHLYGKWSMLDVFVVAVLVVAVNLIN